MGGFEKLVAWQHSIDNLPINNYTKFEKKNAPINSIISHVIFRRQASIWELAVVETVGIQIE